MAFVYFDESIQERAGFIVGAFVFSDKDLTPRVYAALAEAGLAPGFDEFKSGARMAGHPEREKARGLLRRLIRNIKVGLVVVPSDRRASLGNEMLEGLAKIVVANGFTSETHEVYVDEGIDVDSNVLKSFRNHVGARCDIHMKQDSKSIGGLQLADLAAHSLGIMLLEELGALRKTIKVGDNSGYAPDTDTSLGFALWASLRYQFLMSPKPSHEPEESTIWPVFDVAGFGLHISRDCSRQLREAALARFGTCYLGCIH